MRRSDKTRARRAGEADGRAHARAVYEDEIHIWGAREEEAFDKLEQAWRQGNWDLYARSARAAEARLIPRAAHELYYASVNRGAERYIKEALNGLVCRAPT